MVKKQKINLCRLAHLILSSKKILLTTHVNPDGDGVGSILALARGLKQLKKQVQLYMHDPVPKIYKFLPDQQKITKRINSKTVFDLTLVVDVGEFDRVSPDFCKHKNLGITACLDHHKTSRWDADWCCCVPTQASSGELVYKLLKILHIPLDRAMATQLYTAISTDTGSFKYSNTTRESFLIAADLARYGVDFWEVALNSFETSSPERMELLKRVIGRMEIHSSKKIASIVIRQKDFSVSGASKDDTEGLINYPRSIDSVEVAVSFKEQKNKEYKVSLRSKNYVDVARLSQNFNGGGHQRAAGFTIAGDLNKIKKQVYQQILAVLK